MIIHRYIIIEIGRYFFVVVFGLLMLVITMRLASYLADAAEGKIAARHIIQMMGLKLAVSLKDLLPLAPIYFGICCNYFD